MVEARPDRREAATAIASAELLRALKAAVDEVFATMLSTLGVGTKLGDPCLVDTALRPRFQRDSQESPAAVTIEARIDIRGPLEGWICLSCTAQTADDIARGMLLIGANDALAKGEVEDALGECANMIAGVLKTSILDARGSYSIATPRMSTRKGERNLPRGLLAYRLCAGALNAELWLDGGTEPA